MPTLADIRQQAGGAYDDLSDQQLADAVYRKFYSDLPRDEFNAKIGLAQEPTAPAAKPYSFGPLEAIGELGARGINTVATAMGAPPREPRPINWAAPIRLPIIGEPSAVDMGKAALEEGKSAITLPGDVYAGRVNPESDEGVRRSMGLGMLATLPSAGRTVARTPPKPVTPLEVKQNAGAGLEAAHDLGVTYGRGSARTMVDDIADALKITEERAPTTYRTLQRWSADFGAPAPSYFDKMEASLTGKAMPQGAPVTTRELHTLRQELQDIKQATGDTSLKNTDRAAARQAMDRLDEFMGSPPAGAVASGPAKTFADAFATFKTDYATGSKAGALVNLEKRAANQAASANSGLNYENALRQQIRAFVQPNDRGVSRATRAGFSQEQIARLEAVMEEGGGNLKRFAANTLGGGGGVAGPVVSAVGSSFAGWPGAFLPLLGVGLKQAGARAAQNEIKGMTQDILNTSTLAQARAAMPQIRGLPMIQGPLGGQATPLTAGLPLLNERQPLRITVRPRVM